MYFQREGQEKILLCKGGHYMKNKNIGGGGGGGCKLNLISKKDPNAKMRKKCKKKNQASKKFSSLVSLTQYFTKFIFLEQPVQCAKYVFFFFSFFF